MRVERSGELKVLSLLTHERLSTLNLTKMPLLRSIAQALSPALLLSFHFPVITIRRNPIFRNSDIPILRSFDIPIPRYSEIPKFRYSDIPKFTAPQRFRPLSADTICRRQRPVLASSASKPSISRAFFCSATLNAASSSSCI